MSVTTVLPPQKQHQLKCLGQRLWHPDLVIRGVIDDDRVDVSGKVVESDVKVSRFQSIN